MGPVSDTLIIKNFPSKLSKEDISSFLTSCGAINVKIISSKHKTGCVAFARFPNMNLSRKVLHELHQQEILSSYLTVEYARNKDMPNLVNLEKVHTNQKFKDTGSEALLQRFLEKLNTWSTGTDFRTPVPCHLRYHYPPPTRTTLDNICQQLKAVPKFYTQVLHLMNKMNLACPFGAIMETDLNQKEAPSITIEHFSASIEPIRLENAKSESGSESEMSSDNDIPMNEIVSTTKPVAQTKSINRPKRLKKYNVTPIVKAKKTKFEDVFDDPSSVVEPKKKKLLGVKKQQEVPPINSGFGFFEPIKKPDEKNDEVKDVRNAMEEERLEKVATKCITVNELAANRIPEKDRGILPVFKNYAEGAPTCRLYIKNLAKQTSENDLFYIYAKYKTAEESSENIFDVRLMQEGRMKGQAFITLQSVDLAKEALVETNGYILNDKPMVVQFARSAVK